MAEQIRKVDYYSVPIANKIGAGACLLSAFKDAGVNLLGAWGYGIGGKKARMELIPEDGKAFVKAARKAGIQTGKKQTAFLVSGDDRPGAVADLLCKLADAGVNVLAMKASCAGEGRFGGAIFVDSKVVRKAAKALGC